ncbi:MAG TPA: tRNA pseudouridine(55) synthase TruB [Candidatus Limivicinus faecipullorum]|nr:tRNA pseudouridine(55) synthase TruB [Candidatus Limivicinus faecipullorum]
MNGILLIDKAPDWTSNDVVVKLKGILHQRRIGHSGTLDPMATGILVVFVGRATRAVEFAEGHDKRYLASLRLGLVTDTQDTSGRVLEQHPVSATREELEAALKTFRGEQEQVPPMYSAIKHKGRPLYEIARKGGQVERKARKIKVYNISLAGEAGGDYLLDISCSKGTYVRSLCHDLGQALGCGGCMSGLRRLEAGEFRVEDAYTLAQVQEYADNGRAEELLLPVDSLFYRLPACTVTQAQEKKIRCGNELPMELADGDYRVYSPAGDFLMLGREEKGILKTVKSFFEV